MLLPLLNDLKLLMAQPQRMLTSSAHERSPARRARIEDDGAIVLLQRDRRRAVAAEGRSHVQSPRGLNAMMAGGPSRRSGAAVWAWTSNLIDLIGACYVGKGEATCRETRDDMRPTAVVYAHNHDIPALTGCKCSAIAQPKGLGRAGGDKAPRRSEIGGPLACQFERHMQQGGVVVIRDQRIA